MRKSVVLCLLVLLLTACGGSDSGLPTVLPTASMNTQGGSPRVVETPTPSLPPTWTPQSATFGEHIVPVGGSSVTAESGITYTVQPGDTLGKIAAQFGVTVADLANANNIKNWDIIEVGTVLVIPGQ